MVHLKLETVKNLFRSYTSPQVLCGHPICSPASYKALIPQDFLGCVQLLQDWPAPYDGPVRLLVGMFLRWSLGHTKPLR